MKKVFFAVLAIAALMVSCQKEGLVDNRNDNNGSSQTVNERQLVVLGSSMTSGAATKAPVDDIDSWGDDANSIYVYAVNSNPDVEDKLFMNNVGTTLGTPAGDMKAALVLPEPYYYGTGEKDIYSFYAYYLGYEATPAPVYSDGSITLEGVEVKGDNDIMIAATDKTADAFTAEGTMVNPKYLYSEYSARHGVVPNLVFNHMLSKFVFNVKIGSALVEGSSIKLNSISLNSVNSGTLKIAGETTGFVPAEGDKVDIVATSELDLTDEYALAGKLMVVPAGSDTYTLKVAFTQTFEVGDPYSTELVKEITVNDVDPVVTAFEAGKQYVVNITVYGLEAVKVDVELRPWEDAGTVTVDPDEKEDGVYENVICASSESGVFYLATENEGGFVEGAEVINVLDPETAVPDGVYTLDGASKARVHIDSIEIAEEVITVVTPAE